MNETMDQNKIYRRKNKFFNPDGEFFTLNLNEILSMFNPYGFTVEELAIMYKRIIELTADEKQKELCKEKLNILESLIAENRYNLYMVLEP